MDYNHVKVNNNIVLGNDLPFALIAGPCALESRDHAFFMVESLLEISSKLSIPFIFKTSFDKANRTSLKSPRGVGFEKALPIFLEIREKYGCPILTDIHTEAQCEEASKVIDILQIPAFLCRQTDLVTSIAKTKNCVNIKKGQFLSPKDIYFVIEKIRKCGNENILITERGTSFGYNHLVVDPCSLPLMSIYGYPTVIDATHSVQEPGILGKSSGGNYEFAKIIARSAVANNVSAVFVETHQNPEIAPCDGPNMIPLDELYEILLTLKDIDDVSKRHPTSLKMTNK